MINRDLELKFTSPSLEQDEYDIYTEYKEKIDLSNNKGMIIFSEFLDDFQYIGIYAGNNKVIELHGSGDIRLVSIDVFLNASIFRTGKKIYTFINKLDKKVIKNISYLERAMEKVGKHLGFCLLTRNSFQFALWCIVGRYIEDIYTLKDFMKKLEEELKIDIDIRKVEYK